MAGSHLQNLSNPNPTKATKKYGQILKKQARFGEISTKSGYIWWDLARSGQTQQFLAKKDAYFRKNPVFGENFPDSGKNFQFPAKVPNSGYTFFFFPDFNAFFNSCNRSDPTDANHHKKPNRPIFPAVSFVLLRPSTRRWQVESGWVENRLGPTRGQPYSSWC